MTECDKCGYEWDYHGVQWRNGKRVYPKCPKCGRCVNIHIQRVHFKKDGDLDV